MPQPNINFIEGLEEPQIESIQNLWSTRHSDSWNPTDWENWNYATGNSAVPEQSWYSPPPPDSPVTTGEEAEGEEIDLDQQIEDLGLDFPDDEGEESAMFGRERERLEEEYQRRQDEIRAGSQKRYDEQKVRNRLILGESRVALAELGLLSTEPEMKSGTSAVQYIRDVNVENEKDLQAIRAEEQRLLASAKSARDAGDLDIAKREMYSAQERRAERNALRLQAMQEIRAMREAERAGDRMAIEKLQEDRAAKRFKMENAQNALSALIDVNFEGFDKITDVEKDKLEREMGFMPGTLDGYYSQSQKMKALEGWNSNLQTNKNTGEVTALYYRMNPDTGEVEYNTTSLGTFGDRYTGRAGGTTPTVTKITSTQRTKLLQNFSNDDIDFIQEFLSQGDKTINDLIQEIEFTDEELSIIQDAFGMETESDILDTQLDEFGFSAAEKRAFKTAQSQATNITFVPLAWLEQYRKDKEDDNPWG